MTPTERYAKELVEEYYTSMNPDAPDCNISYRQAKECAKIDLNNSIKEIEMFDKTDGYVQKRLDFLTQVLKDIDKL